MEQIGFKGYAQEGRFDPIKAPDEAAKILQRGRDTLRGMEAVKSQDLRNRVAYLQALEQKHNEEARNRGELFQYEQRNEQRKMEAIGRNHATRIQGFRQQAEDAKQLADSFARFSKGASDYFGGIYKRVKEEEYNAELNQALIDGLPIDRQLGQIAQEHDLAISGEAVDIQADVLQATGASPTVVEQTRGLNKNRRAARQKAYSILAGNRFQGWGIEQLATNDKDRFQIIDENGQPKEITPSEAKGSVEQQQILNQMLPSYLKANGLYGLSADFLAPMLERMRSGMESIVSTTRKGEVEQAKQIRIDGAIDVFSDTKSPQAFHDAFRMLTHDVGYGKAREIMFERMFTTLDDNGNHLFSDNEISDILNTTFMGQTKTIGDQYSSEIGSWISKRNQATAQIFDQNQKMKEMQFTAWNDETQKFISSNLDSLDNDALEKLAEKAKMDGNESGAKMILGYMSFTNEGKADKALEENWTQLDVYGLLTAETIRNSTASAEVKRKWLSQVQSTSSANPGKPAMDIGEKFITAALDGRVKFDSLTGKGDPTFVLAKSYAISQFAKDYKQEYLRSGNAAAAERYALEQFQREFQLQGGMYSINDRTKDGKDGKTVTNASFIRFKINPTKPRQSSLGELYQRLRVPGAIDTPILDRAPLESLVARAKSGQAVSLPPQAQAIADMSGGKLSAIDVLQRQLKAHDLEQIKLPSFEAAKQLTGQVGAEYQRLLNYKPNPTRTTIAFVGSGLGDPASARLGGDWQRAADIISKYESTIPDGMNGYDNMNRGGSAGGTVAHGSGTGRKTFGKPLTDMTIGEVMALQQNGQLHAAGRYQFVGISLPSAMKQAGLKATDRFDAANQDRMFAFFLKSSGPGAWVGPMQKGTPEEINFLRRVKNSEISFSASPWRQGLNMNPQLVYRMGSLGYGSTGPHLDVKPVQRGGVQGDPNQVIRKTDLDNFVLVKDKKGGLKPLSAGTITTDDDTAHRARGSFGHDFAAPDGTEIYLRNGARIVENIVDNSARGQGSHRMVIELPDGRRFSFLHGTKA